MTRALSVVLLCGILAWTVQVSAADPERGRELFVERCILCHGEGGGKFRPAPSIKVPDDVIVLEAADMDGDGKADLIAAFVSLNRVGVYGGDGAGVLSFMC